MGGTLRVRISPTDVGQRVTIRSRIAARPGEPGHTDTVGHLRSWRDGVLTIERRTGERVALVEADIVGARVIGPPPVRRSNASPAQRPAQP